MSVPALEGPRGLLGLRALGAALRLLGRERSLWLWSALPVLVNGLALASQSNVAVPAGSLMSI